MIKRVKSQESTDISGSIPVTAAHQTWPVHLGLGQDQGLQAHYIVDFAKPYSLLSAQQKSVESMNFEHFQEF